mmetsp:Transcript_88473/g.159506  ORF Transcript_88473/g.159506 Transcript_88473/m.159506 type:complete len:202 (+) Transcript_88473:567-1172(+)
MMSAPAVAKSSTRFSGCTIIRWQSRIASGRALRRAATTPGPMVMFGTNCPSMTSTCTQSAPAFNTLPTSSPSLAKSAERMEGETCTVLGMVLSFATRGFSAWRATTPRAEAAGPALRRRSAPAPAAITPTAAAATPRDDPGPAEDEDEAVLEEAWPATDVARKFCGAGDATKAAAQPKVAEINSAFVPAMVAAGTNLVSAI